MERCGFIKEFEGIKVQIEISVDSHSQYKTGLDFTHCKVQALLSSVLLSYLICFSDR